MTNGYKLAQRAVHSLTMPHKKLLSNQGITSGMQTRDYIPTYLFIMNFTIVFETKRNYYKFLQYK